MENKQIIMAQYKNTGEDTLTFRGAKNPKKAGYTWERVAPGETIELPVEVGSRYQEQYPSLELISKDVEAQLIIEEGSDSFAEELLSIKGVGKATAAEVIGEYGSRDRLVVAIEGGEDLPFRKEIAEALINHFTE